VIRLDAATVLLQWSAGGLAFLWFTTRHREVGIGYGWLMRSIFLAMRGRHAGIYIGPLGNNALDIAPAIFVFTLKD